MGSPAAGSRGEETRATIGHPIIHPASARPDRGRAAARTLTPPPGSLKTPLSLRPRPPAARAFAPGVVDEKPKGRSDYGAGAGQEAGVGPEVQAAREGHRL